MNMNDTDRKNSYMLRQADENSALFEVDGKYWLASKNSKQMLEFGRLVCTKQDAEENGYWQENDGIADDIAAFMGW